MSIKLKNISKTYNTGMSSQNEVLHDINLEINNGEMLAVKGRSGAGKSTLLHIIGCLDTATAGTYIVDDTDVSKLSDSELAALRNKKFGFIMQDFGLINDDSVIRNVSLPMMFNKTPLDKIKETAKQKLKLLNISHLSERLAGSLSGGEKQRVAISRVLVNNPDYILADEPTGALDSDNADLIMEQLIRLNKMGKTVIIITHDDTVAEKCKRIINISDGVIKLNSD